jgi:hypothetical protein
MEVGKMSQFMDSFDVMMVMKELMETKIALPLGAWRWSVDICLRSFGPFVETLTQPATNDLRSDNLSTLTIYFRLLNNHHEFQPFMRS